MRYVIIGASAAGLSAAQTIRETDPNGEITVLTGEKYYPYSRPSISYLLKGTVEEKRMFLKKPQFYADHNINVITGTRVSKIDREKKVVKAGRKEYPYDKLCLATGSKPFVPHVENAQGCKNVFTFLDLASAKALKKAVNKNTKAVVIGAGLIGMKAAEGLSKICESVDVAELSPRVLPSILDEKSAVFVKKYLEEHGISFHLKDTVVKANVKNGAVQSVELKSGKTLECSVLVIAVGVRPETELAEKAGLEVNRGILIDQTTMQTSDRDIYAAGDCTVSVDMLDGSNKIIALWPNAVYQGMAAGSHMAGGDPETGGAYSVNAIDFYGLRICTCGLINATEAQYSDRVKTDGNAYKRLIFEGTRLVGFVLINSSENAGIYTDLIAKKVDLSTLEGDIMETPSLFLFDRKTRTQKLTGGIAL